jgi:NAD dependent epimerase/dehydratase
MTLNGVPVLVTGADGFIGSHLVERLLLEGAQVRAFCLYNSQGSLGWLDQLAPDVISRLDVRLGDIRDAGFVAAACEGMSVVCHLAALIAIPYSYQAPASFVDTNVTGTLNVLEGVRRHGAQRLIVTSTSEVYGTPDTLPILETHPLQAQSPYAATKVAADQLALAYQRSFGTPVTVLRPFNTFGPRQSTRAVLPTILTQLLAGKTEISLGNLTPRRDLTYVSDTVAGFIAAATALDIIGETIQLGTGEAVSVGDLVKAAGEALGVTVTVRQDPQRLRPDASEVQVLLSDPTKAKKLLGWTPEVGLTAGLALTATWLKQHLNLYRADGYHV